MNVAKLPVILAAIASIGLSGCAVFSRPFQEPEVPTSADRFKTQYDEDDELDVDADFGGVDPFLIRPIETNDPLPSKHIGSLQLSEAGLFDSMQLLFAGTGFSLSIEGGPAAIERYGSIALFNVGGSLSQVMDRLSDAAGFFYRVEGKNVSIVPEQMFVMDLPPSLMDDNVGGIVNTILHLGARDSFVDRANRTLTFRSTKKALKSISSYLDRIRATRSMLVYDIQVYQVDLNDKNSAGIGWNKLSRVDQAIDVADRSRTLTGGSGASGKGLGAVFIGKNLTIDVVFDFLKTQGTVKSLSQPRIALLNGTKGHLRVGQTTSYVSKVTQTQTVNAATTTSSAADTADLKTGIDMTLRGDFHDKTIYSKIDIKIADLIRFNKFSALGVDLNLPQTTDREIKTSVRARPGDLILLGGLTMSRDVATGDLGLSSVAKDSSVDRSELVVALRPRVVNFTKASDGAPPPPAVSSGATHEGKDLK